MNKDELIQLADDYVRTAKEVKAMKAHQDILKNNIIEELDKVDGDSFDFQNGLKADYRKRKGGFDIKAIQLEFNISDAELEKFRKDDVGAWYFKTK